MNKNYRNIYTKKRKIKEDYEWYKVKPKEKKDKIKKIDKITKERKKERSEEEELINNRKNMNTTTRTSLEEKEREVLIRLHKVFFEN